MRISLKHTYSTNAVFSALLQSSEATCKGGEALEEAKNSLATFFHPERVSSSVSILPAIEDTPATRPLFNGSKTQILKGGLGRTGTDFVHVCSLVPVAV